MLLDCAPVARCGRLGMPAGHKSLSVGSWVKHAQIVYHSKTNSETKEKICHLIYFVTAFVRDRETCVSSQYKKVSNDEIH